MCLEATREDEAHLLLSCKSFAGVRERFLATWIRCARLRAADPGEIVTLLLGGELEGRQLDDWSQSCGGSCRELQMEDRCREVPHYRGNLVSALHRVLFPVSEHPSNRVNSVSKVSSNGPISREERFSLGASSLQKKI